MGEWGDAPTMLAFGRSPLGDDPPATGRSSSRIRCHISRDECSRDLFKPVGDLEDRDGE
jgi:hypothetical protein